MKEDKSNKASLESIVDHILKESFKMTNVKSSEIPSIDLYMDQVTTFLDSHLAGAARDESDKFLTKTMINNYTKNNLIPPPDKKKYSKDHMMLLVFIYYLKNFMSMSDIGAILGPMKDSFFSGEKELKIQQIYDRIVKCQMSSVSELRDDILDKAQKAGAVFEDAEIDEDREYMELFTMVSMLGYDLYLKKFVIEKLIDAYRDKLVGSDDKKVDKSEKKVDKKTDKKADKKTDKK
ncbi:MAG: DUF1836 domain-containing protein [Lachnospiraceae bacterium]|nr:DUF1836 domain-containing protein [Candidatus Merdinaster equi]